jgi:MFS family permease
MNPSTFSSSTNPSLDIQWKQVVSLIALDIAIIISWIAYHEYQPKLLEQFGFTTFTLQLAIVQGIILFLTPPIAGWASDKLRQKGGERLPVVNIGISAVSMVFMAVAVTIFANPDGIIKMLFPVMIVFWLISMNIFHSPAISTVEMFVPSHKLPQVMAIFTLISDLSQSLEPSIIDLINFFGAPLTFIVGGVLVFSTGWWFQKNARGLADQQSQNNTKRAIGEEEQNSNLWAVFLMGTGLGMATTFFFTLFPDWASSRLSFLSDDGFKGSYFISILIAFSAFIALPMSKIVEKLGVLKMSFLGLILCLLLVVGVYVSTGELAFGMFLLYPLTFALFSVSALPYSFSQINSSQKVFGIGLFFSGIELTSSIVDIISKM